MFIEHLEELIYRQELIYRSLLVTKNDRESHILNKELLKKDYSVKILKEIDPLVDYNILDSRILIVTKDNFESFIQHIDKRNGGIMSSTYSLIAFSYFIDEITINNLLAFYMKNSKNNANGTLFLDKKFARYLYLKNIVM
jgi:hypothetical protein